MDAAKTGLPASPEIEGFVSEGIQRHQLEREDTLNDLKKSLNGFGWEPDIRKIRTAEKNEVVKKKMLELRKQIAGVN